MFKKSNVHIVAERFSNIIIVCHDNGSDIKINIQNIFKE